VTAAYEANYLGSYQAVGIFPSTCQSLILINPVVAAPTPIPAISPGNGVTGESDVDGATGNSNRVASRT
jgi:hypothetical protein